ncbi:hypothetical protein A3A66_02385 [Microgenomates group bacterium RIFCSPLOWO2_01_FULL_46_13]|nr:MAG: hypothetical protein A2783_00525 [Microgenomates group bacterium RIFCSPHIGHO2_01_FULL_45_11]OGV94821.1 MAG: hypothetical protein A3A66_02385 [Microgenomates group bacterium RIFCSPLOWO2_01_FULL_46_13]
MLPRSQPSTHRLAGPGRRRKVKGVWSSKPPHQSRWHWWLILIPILAAGLVALNIFRTSTWKQNDRFTVVILNSSSQTVELVSLDPEADTISVVRFPPTTQVTAVYGYGRYSVSALAHLGEVEGIGNSLMAFSLQEMSGWPVRAVIPDPTTRRDDLILSRLKLISVRELLRFNKRRLNLFDSWRWFKEVRESREDKVNIIDIQSPSLSEPVVEPDGMVVYELKSSSLDTKLRAFAAKSYLKDSFKIAIVNTTHQSGLATHVGHLLANNGLDVIAVSDFPQVNRETRIQVSQTSFRQTPTGRLIDSLWPYAVWSTAITDSYRADIVIHIGQDYLNFLTTKPGRPVL